MFFLMMNIFYCLYVIIFILVFVGNIFVFIICYKIYKLMIFVLLCFIVSLVLVDLMFMLLFIFDLIVFIGYGNWFGGDFVCKIQSFFIEFCYIVFILILVVISYECLKVVFLFVLVCVQLIDNCLLIFKIIWVIGIVFCIFLLYVYFVKRDEKSGLLLCFNDYMGDDGR